MRAKANNALIRRMERARTERNYGEGAEEEDRDEGEGREPREGGSRKRRRERIVFFPNNIKNRNTFPTFFYNPGHATAATCRRVKTDGAS